MNQAFKTLICPQCGKEFPPAPQHVYKDQKGRLVCSWSCANASYKEAQEKKKAARERAKQRQREYQKQRRAGIKREWKPRHTKAVCVYNKSGELVARYPSVNETSIATGYTRSAISNQCNGRTAARFEYTFKFEKDIGETEKPGPAP